MSRNERLARELHKTSDHGKEGGEFCGYLCNCERLVYRMKIAGWDKKSNTIATLNYYWGALLGAYAVIWATALGGNITWRTPLYWAALWAVFELIAWGIRAAWRRHKGRVRA